MEKQNINLVTSLPARQSMYLSFRFVKVIFGSIFGFMLLIYFLFYITNYFRASNLAVLTKERALLTNEVAHILETSQKSNVSEVLLNSIESLKSKIAAQERVLKLLNTQKQSRFSVYLETLAKEIPSNVWLNHIQIIPEKEYVSLMGYSLDASLISVFVHQLSGSTVYGPYTFKSVEVSDTKDNYFKFVISSKKISVDKNQSVS